MPILAQSRAADLFSRLSPGQQTAARTHDGLYTVCIKSRLDTAIITTYICFTSEAMRQLCRQITPDSHQIPIVQWWPIDALTGAVPPAPGPYRGHIVSLLDGKRL